MMTHPTPSEWQAFLQGKLSDEQSTELAAHLALCPECAGQVQPLNDTFIALARDAETARNLPPPIVPQAPALGLSELRAEQTQAWRQGQGIPVENLLARAPHLSATSESLLVLVVGEVHLRAERGDAPALSEYQQRFPQLAEPLAEQFELLRMLATAPPAPMSPGLAATRTLPPLDVPEVLREHPRYQVQQLLGRGGMGAVYRAQHRLMERTVALKLINAELLSAPIALQRFQQEMKAAAKLTHPNIVQAFDAETAGNVHFLVMEFVPGTDLHQHLEANGPLPLAQACDYIRQAALGLEHAHQRNMVHRDIKPHNLMLTTEGIVKVLDFGLARVVREGSLGKGGLTNAGTVMGTADYIAPEQTIDAHDVDGRADIYSLGGTLYHLLSGQVPYPGGTVIDKMMRHTLDKPAPLRELRPDLPAELVAVVEKMLAKKPELRYARAADVATALAPFVPDAAPTQVIRPAQPPAPPTWSLRRMVALVAAVAVMAAAIVLTIKHPDGKVTTIEVPEGSTAKVDPQGNVEVVLAPPRVEPAPVPKVEPPKVEDAPKRVVPVRPAPLAALARAKVPAWELANAGAGDPAQAPAELVGVVGDSRFAHAHYATHTLFAPDEKSLLTLSADGTAVLWDVATGTKRRVWVANGVFTWAAFRPDGQELALTTSTGQLQLVHPNTGKLVRTLLALPQAYQCVAYHPEGTQLAAINEDGQLRLWSADGKLTHTVAAPLGYRLAYSADGKTLHCMGLSNGTIQIVDPAAGKLQATVQLKSSVPETVLCLDAGHPTCLSITGGIFAARQWDLTTGELRRLFPVPLKDLSALGTRLSPDGQLVFTSGNANAWLWETGTGKLRWHRTWQYDLHGRALSVAFNRMGTRLAYGTDSSQVQMLEVATGRPPLPAIHAHRPLHTTLSPDGRTLASAGRGTEGWVIKLYDAATLAEQRTLKGVNGEPGVLAFSPDGKTLAAGGFSNTAALWDVASGTEKLLFSEHRGQVVTVAWTPDGRHLVTGCADRGVRVFDALSGRLLSVRPDLKAPTSLAIHPNGKWLATACAAGTVRLWSLPGLQPLQTLPGQVAGNSAQSVAFNASGSRLACVSGLSSKRWQVATDGAGLPVCAPLAPCVAEGQMQALAYHPQRDELLSWSSDDRVTLWDDAGQPVRSLRLGQGGINLYPRRIEFSPEGSHALLSHSEQFGTLLRLE
jgi:WD40 repeat protein